MPGDLRDPEQSTWQGHYDDRYDRADQSMTDVAPDMEAYIQSIAVESAGRRLDPAGLDKVRRGLALAGAFHMHPGDENFRAEVRKLVMARKVASSWLI